MSQRVNGRIVKESQFLISQGNDDVAIDVGGGDTIVFRFQEGDGRAETGTSVRFSVSEDLHTLSITMVNAVRTFSNRSAVPIGRAEDTGRALYLNYCIQCIGSGEHVTRVIGYTLLEEAPNEI